jgi:hypothetical protein
MANVIRHRAQTLPSRIRNEIDEDGRAAVRLALDLRAADPAADRIKELAAMTVAKAEDPRCYVGDVVEATETDDGLAIKGRFNLDAEFGKAGPTAGARLRRRLKGLVDDRHQLTLLRDLGVVEDLCG